MKRILIIDDDIDICEMLAIILENGGYETEQAQDGAQGIRLCHERPFDLVITDIFMPGKEGLETIRELRETHPEVHVIAISGGTAKAAMSFLPLAERFGACRSLSKPIHPNELISAVAEVLGDVSP